MLRLRNVLLASVLGIAASAPALFAIPEQASTATVEQVLELAQTIDAVSAAKLSIGYMREGLVRAKDYIATCDYSSVLKAQKDGADWDLVEEELGKVIAAALDLLLGMQPDKDFAWLKLVVCRLAIEKAGSLDEDKGEEHCVHFSCPKTQDPQVLIDAINAYLEQVVKVHEGLLIKRFNFSQAKIQEAEATMGKVIDLAKKVDGLHAAEYFLKVMEKAFAKIKENAAKYDYSNFCKARSLLDVGCEREILKTKIFESSMDDLEAELRLSRFFCQAAFGFDGICFCYSVVDTTDKSFVRALEMLNNPVAFDPQTFVALVHAGCDIAAAQARATLIKRFNLHVPHCVAIHGMA